jgi:colanic acid biosynthesis protein WcaH
LRTKTDLSSTKTEFLPTQAELSLIKMELLPTKMELLQTKSAALPIKQDSDIEVSRTKHDGDCREARGAPAVTPASGILAEFLAARAAEGRRDMPEDLFLLVSRLTPIVNVDLLIKDARGRTLLTWRDDEFYGAGWHIPGGIIRFRETAAERVRAVAASELGAEVGFEPSPIRVEEAIDRTREVRGHFISLLYRCALTGPPRAELEYRGGPPAAGVWKWHASCPPDLLPVHRVYEQFL